MIALLSVTALSLNVFSASWILKLTHLQAGQKWFGLVGAVSTCAGFSGWKQRAGK